MKSKDLLGIVAAILFACSGCDAINERIEGHYILVAVDVREQLSVSYDVGGGASVGRIGPTVTDVGWNKDYIVAATRPEDKPGTLPSFYFLDIKRDSNYGDQYQAVTGPLSKDDFERAKIELKLPEFKKHFPDLR